jgi:hypothetical protein
MQAGGILRLVPRHCQQKISVNKTGLRRHLVQETECFPVVIEFDNLNTERFAAAGLQLMPLPFWWLPRPEVSADRRGSCGLRRRLVWAAGAGVNRAATVANAALGSSKSPGGAHPIRRHTAGWPWRWPSCGWRAVESVRGRAWTQGHGPA